MLLRMNIFSLSICLLACAVGSYGQVQADRDKDMKSIPLRTHSLQQPYLDSDMASRWWDFGGDLLIRADSYIRLAADRPSQSGWLFSRIPLTATNFQIEVEFEISGKGNLHGDGFAMWITKDRATPGSVFGHKDQFEGLGIFFDTYKNNRPGVVFPYVMGMMGDGHTTYDAANDGKANEIGGCSARGLRGAAIPAKARLTYFQDESLELQLQYKATDQWIDCFKVNNIRGMPVKMPNTAYLGFSAHTGELSDNFDIISVETKNLYNSAASVLRAGDRIHRPIGGPNGGPVKLASKKSGGWGWFFFKVIAFCLAIGGSYVGYTAYRTNQRNKRYTGF